MIEFGSNVMVQQKCPQYRLQNALNQDDALQKQEHESTEINIHIFHVKPFVDGATLTDTLDKNEKCLLLTGFIRENESNMHHDLTREIACYLFIQPGTEAA
eukprot:779773_1